MTIPACPQGMFARAVLYHDELQQTMDNLCN